MPDTLASGTFYDGKTANPRFVELQKTGDTLVVKDTASKWQVLLDIHTVQLLENPSPPQPGKLAFSDNKDARLYIKEDNGWQVLKAALPKSSQARLRLPVTLQTFLLYAGLSVGFLGGLLLLVPIIFSQISILVPDSWDQKLGEMAMRQIMTEQICVAQNGTNSLTVLEKKLTKSHAIKPDYNVYVLDTDDVNAYAAPGNNIILLRGLIDNAESPDEVAAIMAHEMAHIDLRHPTHGMIRDLGLSLTIQMLFGGSTEIGSASAQFAGFLTQMYHSRTDERAADDLGRAYLKQADISPDGMVQFFERLKNEYGEHSEWIEALSLLSTHPSFEERIESSAATKDVQKTYTPALNEHDWKNLQNICSIKTDYEFPDQ